MIKHKWLWFFIIASSFGSCDNNNEVDIQSITPANYIDKVTDLAQALDPSMKLYVIESGGPIILGPIDTNGYLKSRQLTGQQNCWSFVYLYKLDNSTLDAKSFLVNVDGSIDKYHYDLPLTNPDLISRFNNDSLTVPSEGWIDITVAVKIAMNYNGRAFLQTYPDSRLTATLSTSYVPILNQLTWTIYFSDMKGHYINTHINALNGNIIE